VEHGKLLLLVQHRFGDISGGAYQLFGLDQATMRLGFEYGLGENINVGIGRSTFMKTYDLFGKFRFAQQNENFPLTIVGNVGGSLPTLKNYFSASNNNFSDKFSGSAQLHLARTIGDVGIQLSPGYLNTGYLLSIDKKLSVFTLGIGGAVKLSKKVAFNLEYLFQ
jgi:opacity protein-like surface antigen